MSEIIRGQAWRAKMSTSQRVEVLAILPKLGMREHCISIRYPNRDTAAVPESSFREAYELCAEDDAWLVGFVTEVAERAVAAYIAEHERLADEHEARRHQCPFHLSLHGKECKLQRKHRGEHELVSVVI